VSIATLHQPHAPHQGVPAHSTRRALRVVGAAAPGPRLRTRPEPATCRAAAPRDVRLPSRDLRRLRHGASHPLALVPPAAPSPARRRQVVPSAPAASLRLTRRGRLSVTAGSTLVVLAAGVLAVGAWLPGAGAASPAGSDVEPVAVRTTTVLPGQTLWEIAARVAPEEDRRDTIVRILEANGLDTARVVAGQQLVLPQEL
jgi:nucleoid-associated protein YgaU